MRDTNKHGSALPDCTVVLAIGGTASYGPKSDTWAPAREPPIPRLHTDASAVLQLG